MQVVDLPTHEIDQVALIGFAWDDQSLPAVAAPQKRRTSVQPKPRFRPRRAVTLHAVPLKDRPHVPFEIDDPVGIRLVGDGPREQRRPGDQDQKGSCDHLQEMDERRVFRLSVDTSIGIQTT